MTEHSFLPQDSFSFRQEIRSLALEAGSALGIEFEEPMGLSLPERGEDAVLVWRPGGERWGSVNASDPEDGPTITFFEGDSWRKCYGVDPSPEATWKSFREVLTHLKAFVLKTNDPVPSLDLSRDPVLFAGEAAAFALTSCKLEPGKPGVFRRIRTVGVLKTMEEVHSVLQDNQMDLYEEGYYPHAVIEAISLERFNAVSRVRVWYVWDDDFEGYRPCEEPDGFTEQSPLGGIGTVEEDDSGETPVFTVPLESAEPWAEQESAAEFALSYRASAFGLDPMPDFDPKKGLGYETERPEELSVAFLVTACAPNPDPGAFPLFLRSRSAGVLPAMEQVHAAVQKNAGDLYAAGRFPYVVVEGVLLGAIYGVSHDRVWYRWDLAQGRYRPCPEPEGMENIVCLGALG